MKRCPTCQRRYADDSLRYCLEDGAALLNVSDAGATTLVMDSTEQGAEPPPTEILYEGATPTVRAYDDQDATLRRQVPAPTVRQQGRPTQKEFQNFGATAPTTQRSTSSVVVTTVVATILLIGLGGLGAWLWLRNSGDEMTAKTETTRNVGSSNTTMPNDNVSTGNTTSKATPTPLTTPTPLSSPTVTPTPPPGDNTAARQEVTTALNGWTETMRQADLNGHMAYYAATLHTYYLANNVSAARVRANVARAFAKYSTFDVKITNLQIDVDPSGTSAVATFDKSFVFSGSETYTGSGLNRFWFEKIGGRWLITGEKDLKTYYVNTN